MKRLDVQKLNAEIEQHLQFELEHNSSFGGSYLVRQNGEILCKRHFGTTDLQRGIPVGDSTLYRIASMTKPITGFAVLILIERGVLTLETKASVYIPEFGEGEAAAITVRHLLTHTAGIKNCALSKDHRKTAEATVLRNLNAGLMYTPGTNQGYDSITAFDALGMIITRASGMDVETFFAREIFSHCGMKDTTFLPSDEQWTRLIAMHEQENGGNRVGQTVPGCVFERFPQEHQFAAGGLISSLDDYSAFAELLLNRGRGLVSDETFAKYVFPHVSKCIMPGSENWGLGVRVITDDAYGTLPRGAFGWSGAYGTHFWVDPENRITAVFMRNSRFDSGAGSKASLRFEKAVAQSF